LVRLPNWVGDVVIALPILDELGRVGFDLVLAGRAWCDDLLAAYPLLRVPVTRNHLAAARGFRRLGVDRGMLLTRSIGSALEMRVAGIRAVGYRAQGRTPLLYRSLRKRSGDHLLDYYWRVGGLACATHGGDRSGFTGAARQPVLQLAREHRADADAALSAAEIAPPFQVWCPLATNRIHGHSKVWPRFTELGRRMAAEGVQVVCCPGPGQEEQTMEALPGALVLDGLGLGAMAAVMERAEFVLANDTGPMHVAAGVGALVLGLFGPGSNPRRTGPIGGRMLGGHDGWPDTDAVHREVRRLTAA
jgi:heptosyltransferase-2